MGYQVGTIDAAVEDIPEEQVNADLLKEPDAPDELNTEICAAVSETKSWNKEPGKNSRLRHALNRPCRLLCPQCCDLKHLRSANNKQITLVCGHSRPEVLPVQPGHLSIESLHTESGQQAFPVNYADEATRQRSWNENHK